MRMAPVGLTENEKTAPPSRRPHRQPKRSLRTILILWFLLFAIVPLAFITGYSVVKYEQAIDQELRQRLKGNSREIASILRDYETALSAITKRHAEDPAFIYYLSTGAISQARTMARDWMKLQLAQRLNVFDQEGRQMIALFRSNDEIKRLEKLEEKEWGLRREVLQNLPPADPARFIEFPQKEGDNQRYLDLIIFHRVRDAQKRVVGYIEEIISLDEAFLNGLKKRLNINLIIFDQEKRVTVASHPDLYLYKGDFFTQQAKEDNSFFDLTIQNDPYGFVVRPLQWGDQEFFIGLGASKKESRNILRNVNYAFFSVVGGIVILLIIVSVISSRILLKPVQDLLNAIEEMNPDKEPSNISSTNETEFGLLTESFNDMSKRIYTTQRELKSKIVELERANQEIKETQAKLIHTTKMASLGQLVAGIAHELNNPIGFIYSNMGHLKDYSKKLIEICETAERSPSEVQHLKKSFEFDYVVEDLPKLIQSCEDGARRVRDIVIGLRNFSRIEEAKLKEVDIHLNLDSTLQLLAGETKNRIEIERNYGAIPLVTCYASQVNQVFMNILSNACQAIEGEGKITISTNFDEPNDLVMIRVRDTGPGIPADLQDKIFDPFFTTKPVGQGTGLGLSISYGIIKKHGGDIVVTPDLKEGTEFVISLPRQGVL